jgi:diacylglycerol kinase family enzyme
VPKACLIVNPVASGVTDRTIRQALDGLSEYADVAIAETKRPGHATELARDAVGDGYQAVVILAGDGTANEVLNGIGTAGPVGVLPAGGTSVLPRSLGMPRSVLEAARQVGAALEAGRTRPLTLGLLNGRRFAFAAGIGFDAETVRRVDARGRASGRRPGDVYYAWQVVRTFMDGRYARPLLRVEVPAHDPLRASSVLVANGHPWSYLGPLPIRLAPRARFDGNLDVVVPVDFRRRHGPRYLAYLLATGAHSAGDDPRVAYLHDVRELVVHCDEPLPAEADGDDIGDVTEARFGVERDAVRLLV